MQQLSIATYLHEIGGRKVNFNLYFEAYYKEIITESLTHLKIKDIAIYKDIYYKYFKIIHTMSINNAINFIKFGTSNKKELFDYWSKNRKNMLQEIIDLYKQSDINN